MKQSSSAVHVLEQVCEHMEDILKGTLNSREWKTRHHTAVVENARVENTAP